MRQFKSSGVRRCLGIGSTALAALLVAAPAWAKVLTGQPTPGGMGLQPPGSPLRVKAMFFNDAILTPVLGAVVLFVLALLIYVAVKFNKRSNPVAARFSHNTPVEVLWTVTPVLILMFFAVFSFRLLYDYHNTPKADMTIKVTGNQWYWNYEYPEMKTASGTVSFDSNILPEADARRDHKPYKLAVDNPLVVPAGKTVKVLITGADVLHSFFIPSFGIQNTAVPGRVNETWFRADQPGVYYGQCNELCGVQHAFMPIEVDVVPQANFEAWRVAHLQSGTKSAPAVPATQQTAKPVPTNPPAKTVAAASLAARG